MRRQSGWIYVGLVLLPTAGVGVWLGEGLRGLPGSTDAAVAGICALAGAALSGGGAVRRAGFGFLALLVFTGAWVAGAREASAAFNASVARCEELRERLEDYRSRSGRYPSDLSQLEGALPGGRILRGSLLHYARREQGYVLEFSDWLTTHSASESEACLALK